MVEYTSVATANICFKTLNFQEEITKVFGTVHRTIFVMQCLGFLCGLLVCAFFSAMLIIMWHFYSIGEIILIQPLVNNIYVYF